MEKRYFTNLFIIISECNKFIIVNRDVVNIWRGTNPDHNANKTTADVVLALKQFKQITQQPQNAATSRARYDFFTCLILSQFVFRVQEPQYNKLPRDYGNVVCYEQNLAAITNLWKITKIFIILGFSHY